ncbi:MAG: HNH endonuclease [Burkholderiaceae bacterium]|nr:HNH endonuclease [Burkholderiaceae bacterium]
MLAACASAWAAEAVPRSAAVKAEFRRSNPCPSTGSTRGACPGWQVDHREALVCGGRDEVGNMQWLSVEEHKAKTRVEVKLCRSHVAAQPPASAGER